MKIEQRPWKHQDLLDDLQSIIDEEPDSYLNTRRLTLCMARDYLKEYFSSLSNDPLTKDELISILGGLPEITGEPVFFMDSNGGRQWHLLRKIGSYAGHTYVFWEDNKIDLLDDYGEKWWAYLRVPDGVMT